MVRKNSDKTKKVDNLKLAESNTLKEIKDLNPKIDKMQKMELKLKLKIEHRIIIKDLDKDLTLR